MFGKCTRKLVLRWSLLVFGLTEVGFAIFWLAAGSLPQANQFMVNSGLLVSSPWVLTRLVDPLVMMIPVALLVWMILDVELIERRLGYADGPMFWGCVFGICGSVVIGLSGMVGLVIGTIISCVVIVAVGKHDHNAERWQIVMTQIVAVITIWPLNTLFQGTVAGFIYVSAAIALAIATDLLCLGVVIVAPKGGVGCSIAFS